MQKNIDQPLSEGSVPALRRAVRILNLIASSNERLTAADITKATKLPKSTAHGLLSSMMELDLLIRTNDGTFQLGSQPMRWANSFLADLDVVSVFQEHFANNPELANYTVTLTTLENDEVVYIGCRNSNQPLGFTFRIGMRLPAPFTATGKILLSALPESELHRLFSDYFPAQMTARSVKNIQALSEELTSTRQKGFSVDDGQIREGMTCIGAALHNHSGKPIAGIAISLIGSEASPQIINQLGETMRTTAQALSRKLGAVS